ncbi:kinase-like protein [Grosmannia clavigera kw1407]|uniref:non-specific serine/threonine protein kinase n=1 Tax=Grosmannia clavigera (strain kw1407 / UAMH 11150) TaxID=655863 RepID=F0XFH3_GROCL|nr:kinase-like protein [Grosmannia clavigera kw1407]EFX03808.1 kinase-like protein [Grosmannia clavigera kw1407]
MEVGTDDKQPEAVNPLEIHPESPSDAPGAEEEPKSSPSVRFQSKVQEIGPVELLPETDQTREDEQGSYGHNASGSEGVTQEQIRALTNSMRTAHLQGLRIANFSYEPFSLPASRTTSHDDGSSHHTTRQHTPISTTGPHSPMLGAKGHDMQSPPLTPLGSAHVDGEARSPRLSGLHHGSASPQAATREASPARMALAAQRPQRPASSDDIARRPASSSGAHDHPLAGNHRNGLFSIGPTTSGSGGPSGGSLPVSRESSASERSASQYYSRPFTPSGDANDPYAANKRHPQNKIEPRFVFSRLSRRKDHSPTASSISLSKYKDEKRHSGFFNNHHHHRSDTGDTVQADEGSASSLHSRQGSMSDLKRFFKLGPSHHHKIKRAVSPALSIRSARSSRATDNAGSRSNVQMPFADDSLSSKYGKLGKVLGAGAGGSVRLMKRSEDSTVFAVKEFRARHTYESEKEYVKKLTAEYCIGSSLHHGNIIETLDIISEKGKWYEVMEYAPYDLFAIVMSGRMSRPEIACCFLQILSGVTYLHSMGLAHRDLKLDNVVVSEHGIMKIIDFGSAHVYQYPFENGVVMASGIVGSDPYLAPEVYDDRKYDPTAVDIWSLAIIYCCMTLRRFPWKVPRTTDNSYKLFAADPTPGHDPMRLGDQRNRSSNDTPRSEDEKKVKEAKADGVEKDVKEARVGKDDKATKDDKNGKNGQAARPSSDSKDGKDEKSEKDDKKETGIDKAGDKSGDKPAEKKEVIKGPWRILRLLPRESRHVIGGMLKIDPKDRIKMGEILKDPWVCNTVICLQTQPGKVIRANTHTHVLEAPAPAMK